VDGQEQAAIDEAGAFRAALDAELVRWRALGRAPSFFWRDDDAADATPALARLVALSGEQNVPLGLAAIPARLSPALGPAAFAGTPVRVLQHGFAHENHAKGSGAGAWELGPQRPASTVLDELARGRAILAARFGDRFVPALAPPWNRIDAGLVPALPGLGFSGLSAAGPRPAARPAPGLAQANIHWDLLDWRRGGRFRGYEAALQLVEHLRLRRLGESDPEEPIGLLSHHLDMDADAWAFLARFLELTRRAGAVWRDPAELFA
jgi:hypothetical protein